MEVSVIIPILNEEKYIRDCIKSVVEQDFPKNEMELILVDGCSIDGTIDIIKDLQKKYSFIRLLSNPQKKVQYALNIGVRNARGKYIVRMDAHAEYARDYVSQCLACLKQTDADNVGGPTFAAGKTETQKVIAAAYHSPFALGGGTHYIDGYEGYADTVSWGAFKRQTLIDIGLYDENLPRSEDYPRDRYLNLFKLYFEYGVWKIAVIKKHRTMLRLTHMVPMLFVMFLLVFGLGSLFSNVVMWTFLSVLVLYGLLDEYFSFKNKYVSSLMQRIKLMYVHFILHVSYGLGFWVGIFKFAGRKWPVDSGKVAIK